jgi:protein-S-isoprenylcysteine O-methyltransferase Ste14
MFIVKLIIGGIVNVAIFWFALFIPAGTFHWPRAWLALSLMLIATLVSILWLYPHHRDLLAERMKPPIQKGQPLADKITVTLFLATYCSAVVFIPLDLFRFRLLTAAGAIASTAGLLFFAGGRLLVTLTLRENAFAALVVRHQKERQQRVIDTGPYRVVRHPMYAGTVATILGLPLWLGSYAATLAGSVPIFLLCVRIVFEESFLRTNLQGYSDYSGRVRYRLIPFVW